MGFAHRKVGLKRCREREVQSHGLEGKIFFRKAWEGGSVRGRSICLGSSGSEMQQGILSGKRGYLKTFELAHGGRL